MESDGSRLFCTAVCVILMAVRFYFACTEAAACELGENKIRSWEDENGGKKTLGVLYKTPRRVGAAYSAHKTLNSFLLCLASVYMIYTGTSTADKGYIIGVAAAVTSAWVLGVNFLCAELPAAVMRGEKAERFAAAGAFPVKALTVVMLPFTVFPAALTKLVCPGSACGDTVTEEEILMLVDAGNETGSIDPSERDMINNVFEFHEMTVSDVMTHRTDIVAVNENAELPEVVYTAINSGFSRIPVYRDSIDHIVGIICVKDLLCLIGTRSTDAVTVKSFLRDAEYVPESSMCGELFKKLTAEKQQLAVAVDEYGGTAGLVTMEDLVEAIVGNIQDEYDNESEDVTSISDNTYTVNGTADPADTMELLGRPFEGDSGFDTMSAFIISLLGRIPEDGETPSVCYEGINFTVLLTEDMRIVKIKAVTPCEEEKKEKELSEDEDIKNKKN